MKMKQELCRYEIHLYWKNRKSSYLETAILINKTFTILSQLDEILKDLIFVERESRKDLHLSFPDKRYDDRALGDILYKEHKYWLNKMYPNVKHDINFKDHYGIVEIIKTKGEPLKVIKFTFNVGIKTGYSNIIVEFPRDFEREFDWYKKILATLINIFEPDYGGLYPIVMQKLEPPKITGGWISYFSDEIKISEDTFSECIKLPVLENKFMYEIEDNHMIRKNEEQFEKLRRLVEKFKKLNVIIS